MSLCCNSLAMSLARHARRGAFATMATTTTTKTTTTSSTCASRIRRRQQHGHPVLRAVVASSSSSSSRAAFDGDDRVGGGDPSSSLAALASVAVASATLVASSALQSSTSAGCESSTSSSSNDRLEVAGEEDDGVVVRDGMDAGVVGTAPPSSSSSSLSLSSSGPADAEEDGDDREVDEIDGGGEDEETTCSICLINRQGPCRGQWLKFERCMKEHGTEKGRTGKGGGGDVGSGGGEVMAKRTKGDGGLDGDDDGKRISLAMMEAEWDAFMEKSTRPGEDDDEEEGGEGEDEEEEEEEEEERSADSEKKTDENDDGSSLAERCDKFMIPWIGCIQEHRNAYTLISNAFYRDDYIDPLESAISDDRRLSFPIMEKKEFEVEEIDDVVRGYVVKFHGVEIDLGNWKEHVEADDDDVDANDAAEAVDVAATAAAAGAEPHLINAHARFHLSDPNGRRPIEVAYIRDQNGTLLGFDSFSKVKRGTGEDDEGGFSDEVDDVDVAAGAGDGEAASSSSIPKDGECTFHIIPGKTTSIIAYAVYRGARGEGGKVGGGGGGGGEDVLYYTPEIPLPRSGSRT